MKRKDKWLNFEEWKCKIVEISDVFDFFGYNSIIIEVIYNNMKNYIENFYYIF